MVQIFAGWCRDQKLSWKEKKLGKLSEKDQSFKKRSEVKSAGGHIIGEADAGSIRGQSCSRLLWQKRGPLSLGGETDSGITFKEVKRSDNEYTAKQWDNGHSSWPTPISAVVPQKLKQKIWEDKFIDLAIINNLLPDLENSNFTFKQRSCILLLYIMENFWMQHQIS